MSERLTDKRLEKIKAEGKTIYSISRLDCINRCKYEAYRTYVLGERGDNNVYGMLGTKVHDVLENIVNNKATEADLQPAVDEEFEDIELLGLNFPKDAKGEDSIRNNWIANMKHFCATYKSPRNKGDLHTEELFIYETTKGHILQGYIDLYKDNKDGTISIYDYKTSSMYKGDDLKEHGRQLVLYAMGMEQAGHTVRSVAWIFLKYVNIEFMGKKTVKSKDKTLISKTVERRKIAVDMASYVENDLYELGYDDIDAEIILNDFKQANSFDVLPDELKNKYKVKPCVFEYELTDEIKAECENYINNTIEEWENIEEYPPKNFTKIQKNGREVQDIYYDTALCSHFKNCPFIQEFLDRLNMEKNDEDDMFS